MQNNTYGLTLFSFGAGQESTYFLHRLCTDKEFYKKHIKGRLLVVGSNTGDEHGHTYQNVNYCRELCEKYDIEFYWLNPADGFHGNTWQSLFHQYTTNNSIGSAAFKQTCTDNLKVKVVDRFLEFWIKKNYGYTKNRKASIYQFVKDHGMIRLILGFAVGEESRTKNGNKFDDVWKKLNVVRYFALIEDKITRQICIDYNEEKISHTVWPSNCLRCFYQSDQEVLWLYRFYPEKFFEWVEAEALKIFKYQCLGHEKNFGVYGKITLIDKLKKALKLYGNWSDDRLCEYKYSHGHCIKSTY